MTKHTTEALMRALNFIDNLASDLSTSRAEHKKQKDYYTLLVEFIEKHSR
jgi:hypothetical protein